jgi:hypothetical protein
MAQAECCCPNQYSRSGGVGHSSDDNLRRILLLRQDRTMTMTMTLFSEYKQPIVDYKVLLQSY